MTPNGPLRKSDDEQLATALERKFNYAVERCELGPGKRVLEIGPGWGAFAGYALQSGTDFTGITISTASQDFDDIVFDVPR